MVWRLQYGIVKIIWCMVWYVCYLHGTKYNNMVLCMIWHTEWYMGSEIWYWQGGTFLLDEAAEAMLVSSVCGISMVGA